ncbi:hypothetical protein HYX08_06680 [Candidatus Woesearchaeota archaeon]|nr:hypothetical protein [Candidatus Woesearchaeota archaeon]
MSVQLFPGVTVSGKYIIEYADEFKRPSLDPFEIIVQKAAARFSRQFGIRPFVDDERSYFTAVELARKGWQPDRAVALLLPSNHGTAVENDVGQAGHDDSLSGPITPQHDSSSSNGDGQNGYLTKPSRNVYERTEVNSHFRIPLHKLMSHKDPKKPLGDGRGVQYGEFTTIIDANRAADLLLNRRKAHYYDLSIDRKFEDPSANDLGEDDEGFPLEFKPGAYVANTLTIKAVPYVSGRQQRAFAKLVQTLRSPTQTEGRQGKLMKLYDDLKRFGTSLIPSRDLHNQLMASLEAAVNGNLKIDVYLKVPSDGSHVFGYGIRRI